MRDFFFFQFRSNLIKESFCFVRRFTFITNQIKLNETFLSHENSFQFTQVDFKLFFGRNEKKALPSFYITHPTFSLYVGNIKRAF